ncbi:MAG: hypothetical protein Q9180_003204 [Flavoplaca navasiana]
MLTLDSTAVGLNRRYYHPKYNEIKINGSVEYQEMMERLSLPSSRHFSPPYNNIWERIADTPRQLARRALKKLYLPASRDVAILSEFLDQITRAVADSFVHVEGAWYPRILVSTPHLVALYQEDILDAIEYGSEKVFLGGAVMMPVTRGYDQPRTSIAAMAGNGWGLCANYTDVEDCRMEEMEMPERRLWTIEYTDTSLHVQLQTLKLARLEYEPYDQRNTRISFDFNCHASLHGPRPESPYFVPDDPNRASERYADDMMAFLGDLPRILRDQGPITEVQILSDCRTDKLLRTMVSTIIAANQKHEPHYSDGDNTFLGARGARELAERSLWRQEHNHQEHKAKYGLLRVPCRDIGPQIS